MYIYIYTQSICHLPQLHTFHRKVLKNNPGEQGINYPGFSINIRHVRFPDLMMVFSRMTVSIGSEASVLSAQ